MPETTMSGVSAEGAPRRCERTESGRSCDGPGRAIITCPCALALAIPAVQVVASGALFRAGVILHAGDAIERLAEADTVVFDKTGTLTLPEPGVVNAADLDPELIEMAARLALSSRHPLAAAVAREARDRRPYEGAVEEPGQGVRAVIEGREARLGSPAFCGLVARRKRCVDGAGHLRHRLQPCRPVRIARRAPKAAPGCGGGRDADQSARPRSGHPVGRSAGRRCAHCRSARYPRLAAGLTPVEKIAVIDLLKAQGRRILMVGDGLNDAPALAAAHVSLSPISAADLTQAQADGVFLGERLMPVLDALTIARRARRLMKQNLWLAAIYNAVAVPIAIAGYVTPLIAHMRASWCSRAAPGLRWSGCLRRGHSR